MRAVPSYARQTGLPCASCHYTYPELTAFGRAFKLNGYTITNIKQIVVKGTPRDSPLKINEFLPLSAFIQLSTTGAKQPVSGTQNWSAEFPQQLSLFFAGGISEHAGAFVQMHYNGKDSHFVMDQTDIRYSRQSQFGERTVRWGITFTNQPGTEDLWNSTPAWRFPWGTPDSAPAPSAATLIDGPLAQDVAGVGAYVLFANHLYADASVFRSAHAGGPQPNPGTGFAYNIAGGMPYWRVAWQQNFGSKNYLEFGTFGLHASVYPNAVTGLKNRYTDNAADFQYERHLGDDTITAHGTWIHESSDLAAAVDAGTASVTQGNLRTGRIDATYHFGNRYTATGGAFSTAGSADTTLYAPAPVTGSLAGKPNTSGYIFQAGWWPVQNVELLAQYTGYTKFNGGSSNYDGSGRNASSNNGVYFLVWFVF